MIGALPALIGVLFGAVAPGSRPPFSPPPRVQAVVLQRYLRDLQTLAFKDAYALLDSPARAYYRDAANLRSIYIADGYRIEHFVVLGARASAAGGSLFFARETARFHDHAHDVDLRVTATVPVGVVLDHGLWRIKDPGHPWRAFRSNAASTRNGLRVSVKKVSFFTHRIETVVTFANLGESFVTLLPYGRSSLRDAGRQRFGLLETRDWSLTDKALFEGLRLAPRAQYTGVLTFESARLDNTARIFSLIVGPLLADRSDAPFVIEVNGIAAGAATRTARD